MNRTYSLTRQKPNKNIADDKYKRKSDGYYAAIGFQNPKYLPENIKDFVISNICLKKEKTGLGISIIGGSDTHLGKVMVSAINLKGAAGKDGRLRCGDQLLSVNNNDLTDVTHDEAVQILRLAKNPVNLSVYRENIETLFTSSNDPEKEVSVVLRKGINDSIGLGIYARKDGKGVFVTYIAPGSLAETSGLIQQGDRILQCNGRDMRHANQQDAVNYLKSTFGEVRLLIGRSKDLENVITDLIERINRDISKKQMEDVFTESRPRSRSDCMSVKSKAAEQNKTRQKPRTLTVNTTCDPDSGSTLDLLSNQPFDSMSHFHNVNYAYQGEATKGKDSELKSTLKKHGKRGGKKEHVSFEMSIISEASHGHRMYGGDV